MNKAEFQNPSPKYRPKPFWFWNNRLEEDELLRQITEMKNKGLGGFFIHARFGLETEYFSDEWFSHIEACIIHAGKLDMEVWIYDENAFPSGIGDMVISTNPKHTAKYVECIEYDLNIGQNCIDLDCLEVMGVKSIEAADSLIDYTYDKNTNRIHINADKAVKAAVYAKRILTNPNNKLFCIDYMNADTVKAFIDFAYEPYKKRFSKYFGTVVRGFFTDEPTLLPWHQDLSWYKDREDGRLVPWDDNLEVIVKEKYNYDIAEVFDALFLKIGDDDGDKRRAFFQSVTDLFKNNYFGALADWCGDNNLELTGHLLLEEGLYFNTIFSGSVNVLRPMHMPGTDQLSSFANMDNISYMVGKAPHLPQVKSNSQGQKAVVSLARMNNRQRVLTECFGCGGWDMTYESQKSIINWLSVNRYKSILSSCIFLFNRRFS